MQSVPEVVLHPETAALEKYERCIGLSVLTHSVKEELEEVKNTLVFSVRPEQMMP